MRRLQEIFKIKPEINKTKENTKNQCNSVNFLRKINKIDNPYPK